MPIYFNSACPQTLVTYLINYIFKSLKCSHLGFMCDVEVVRISACFTVDGKSLNSLTCISVPVCH
jgi:hypothetical protein